jgi:four helix bundle protein
MASIKRFEDILAWQKARVLVHDIHQICETGKLSKDFRLRDQLTSAAVSSMSNIAEGFGRKNDKEFIRFLDYSWGSITEVQSLLYVILDNNSIQQDIFDKLFAQASEVASLIAGFSSYLQNNTK